MQMPPRQFSSPLRSPRPALLTVAVIVAMLALPGAASAQAGPRLPLPPQLCEQLSQVTPIIDQYCELLPGVRPDKPIKKVTKKIKKALKKVPGGGGGSDVRGLRVGGTLSPGTTRQLAALGEDGQGVLRLPGVRRSKGRTKVIDALKPSISRPVTGMLRPVSKDSSFPWEIIPALIALALLITVALLRRRGSGGSGMPPTLGG